MRVKTLRHGQGVAVCSRTGHLDWIMPMHFLLMARCGKIMIGLQHMQQDIIVCLIQRFHQLYLHISQWWNAIDKTIPFYFKRTELCTPRWLRHLNLGMNPMESLDGLGNAFPRHGSDQACIQSPKENCRYRYYGVSYMPK